MDDDEIAVYSGFNQLPVVVDEFLELYLRHAKYFFIGLLFTPAHGSFLDKSVKFVGNHKKLALFLAGAALIVYRAKKVRNKIKEIDQEIDKEKIQNAQNEKNEQVKEKLQELNNKVSFDEYESK